jgi:hypothetical protein
LEPPEYSFTYKIFFNCFTSYSVLPEEILVPFLQLMFDCDKILLSSDELFYESLMFFGRAFQNSKLIRLATQILNNMVS